jgi:hypothetical protein
MQEAEEQGDQPQILGDRTGNFIRLQIPAASAARPQNQVNHSFTLANAQAPSVTSTKIGTLFDTRILQNIGTEAFASLTTWLSHSKKKTCDVCKHPYSFTKGLCFFK